MWRGDEASERSLCSLAVLKPSRYVRKFDRRECRGRYTRKFKSKMRPSAWARLSNAPTTTRLQLRFLPGWWFGAFLLALW